MTICQGVSAVKQNQQARRSTGDELSHQSSLSQLSGRVPQETLAPDLASVFFSLTPQSSWARIEHLIDDYLIVN